MFMFNMFVVNVKSAAYTAARFILDRKWNHNSNSIISKTWLIDYMFVRYSLLIFSSYYVA